MKNSADLGGCYPPRPSASVDNTFLDLQNSSYPTQPHSIIYGKKVDNDVGLTYLISFVLCGKLASLLSNRAQVSKVYRLINHLCW